VIMAFGDMDDGETGRSGAVLRIILGKHGYAWLGLAWLLLGLSIRSVLLRPLPRSPEGRARCIIVRLNGTTRMKTNHPDQELWPVLMSGLCCFPRITP
jgi:hypothetical protein